MSKIVYISSSQLLSRLEEEFDRVGQIADNLQHEYPQFEEFEPDSMVTKIISVKLGELRGKRQHYTMVLEVEVK